MNFIKISEDTLLNVAAISTIRFYEREVVQTGQVRGETGLELVADLVTLNGSKHTIACEAADELSRITRTT